MRDDSFVAYVCAVFRHWRALLLGSVVVGVGFVFLDLILESRWIRFAIVLGVVVIFLFYATFKAWLDQVRTLRAQRVEDLLPEARDLAERLAKFIDLTEAEMRTRRAPLEPVQLAAPPTAGPPALDLMSDRWLTQISGWEAAGRDVRHRVRVHLERLEKAGVKAPIGEALGQVLDLQRRLQEHIQFLVATADAAGGRRKRAR